MEFLKKFFRDEDRIIGLSGFKKDNDEVLRAFVPKFNPSKPIYSFNYQKNFFLM